MARPDRKDSVRRKERWVFVDHEMNCGKEKRPLSPRTQRCRRKPCVDNFLHILFFSLFHSRISVLCFFCLHNTQLFIVNIDCEQYTHKYSTYRVAHSMITFHHANTRSSRLKAQELQSSGMHIFVSLKK